MGRLDARQLTKRRILVGTYTIPVTAPDSGVLQIQGTLWYVKVTKVIVTKIRIIRSKTNNGASISKMWEESWPLGGDIQQLKEHLRAVTNQHYQKFRAGEWPDHKNYLSLCDRRAQANFISNFCSTCSAGYCTVER